MSDDKTVIAVDFETADYNAYSACAVSLARITGGEITEQASTLIKPPTPHFCFTYIHGLTWNDVKDAPTFAECYDKIAAFTAGADYMLAHNAPFDRGVMNACCDYYGIPRLDIPYLCTVRGCRRYLSLPRNSLDVVCRHLNIPLNHHDASSDTLAAAKIFLHLQTLGLDCNAIKLKPPTR